MSISYSLLWKYQSSCHVFPLLCWRLRYLPSCTAFTYLCDPLYCMFRLASLELGTAAALTLGWEKCSSTAPCAQGACWWGFLPLGALLKHTCQLQCCDSCHLMDQHIPHGRPHVSVCVPLMQSITAVPFPVTHCTCFSSRNKASSR